MHITGEVDQRGSEAPGEAARSPASDGGAISDRIEASVESAEAEDTADAVTGTDSDLVRVQQLAARFIGTALLVYCLAMTPGMIRASELTAWWWLPVSLALVVVPAVALFGASFLRTTTWALPLGILSSVGYLLATALWFLAWTGDIAPESDRWPVWLVQFPGVAGLALVLAVHFRLAIAHLIVATTLVHTANQLACFGELRPWMYTSTALTIGLTGVFMAVGIVTVTTARSLDRTRATAIDAAALSASMTARETERSRYDALIHDRVIACLLAVRPGPPERRLVSQARSALDEIEAWHRGDAEARGGPNGDRTTALELLRRIKFMVTQVDEAIEVDVGVEDATTTYPADVATALVDGLSEAVRNSTRHAGDGAERTVVGDLASSSLWAAVIDDGVGFDPDRVDVRRFGIEVGLRRRMRAIPGGDVEVRSSPGRGTMVRLSWVQPFEQP